MSSRGLAPRPLANKDIQQTKGLVIIYRDGGGGGGAGANKEWVTIFYAEV